MSTPENPTQADIGSRVHPRTLKLGSEGADVGRLQRQLGQTEDNKFGTKTEAAVKAFQRQNGLKPDGQVGPKTRAKLTSALAGPENPRQADLGASRRVRILRRGDQGADVGRLQRQLGQTEDNKFGTKTEAAVKAFQRQNGLKPDGQVGPKTRAKLREAHSKEKEKDPKACSDVPEVAQVISEKYFELRGSQGSHNYRKFYQDVKTGGPADLKNLPEFDHWHECGVLIGGNRVAADVPGNILFGAYGGWVFAGLTLVEDHTRQFLLSGAGLAQAASDRNFAPGNPIKNFEEAIRQGEAVGASQKYFDDPCDSAAVEVGYHWQLQKGFLGNAVSNRQLQTWNYQGECS